MMLLDDCLHHHARHRRQRAALSFDRAVTSYQALDDRVSRCANLLAARGIGRGDRVAILTENHPDFATLLFAAARCGAILVPLNYRLSAAEITAILAEADPRLLVGQPKLLDPLLQGRQWSPGQALTLGGDVPGVPSLEAELSRAAASFERIERHPDDDLLLQYTSGTTGAPKGVVSTHRGWITASLIEPPLKGIFRDSNYLGVLPMCHTGGAKWVVEVLFAGATLTIAARFDPPALLRTIEAERVTNVTLVPTMLYQLLDHPDAARHDLSSLAYVNYGGGPMLERRLREAMARFGCRFTQGYGMTELAGGSITFASPEDHMQGGAISPHFGSAGQPLIDCDVRLIGEDGEDVATGDVGEVLVRSGRVTPRYWGSDRSPVDADGYYHTGDLARIDDDGYVTIVDRAKDMIISGGLNIYSKEVEDVLTRHEAIAEAYVVGVPDDTWGEAVKAVVVLRAGAEMTSDDVQSWCRANLAGYKKPSRIDFATATALPRTSLGKVVKRDLRDDDWAAKVRTER